MSIKKVGGIWFVALGPIGFSVYRRKRRVVVDPAAFRTRLRLQSLVMNYGVSAMGH